MALTLALSLGEGELLVAATSLFFVTVSLVFVDGDSVAAGGLGLFYVDFDDLPLGRGHFDGSEGFRIVLRGSTPRAV